MLADLLLSRVERLSDAGRWVVRVAAVAGRRVDDELVRRVSGLDEAAAGEALREVVSHQLLVPAGTGYTFRHALLREAVYADLLARARRAAAFTDDGRPRAWLGLEGHAWLARAEAERRRVDGVLDPDLWRRAADLFTYRDPDGGFVYEVARSRWRLAEALAERGDRDGAAAQWRPAVAAAERLGAAPLLAALRDLGARARLGGARPAAGAPGPLGALTAREREVL